MITELVVIQPIDLCNLNCSYCYLPGRRNTKKMSDDILEQTMKVIFNSEFTKPTLKRDKLKILYHSGEPLLAGMDFYEKALAYMHRYNVNKRPLEVHFQTNATPINQTWCDFIKDHKIEVAVSVDGPEFLHDKYRKNWNGRGTHRMVMKGVECLRKNNLPLRVISVLTKDSLNHPIEMYEFYKMHGFESVNFNVEEQEGIHINSSMKIHRENRDGGVMDKYFQFMSTFYDLWEKDGKPFHLREFDRIFNAFRWNKLIRESIYLPSIETVAFGIITISKDGKISTFSPELSSGIKDDPEKFTIGHIQHINRFDDLISNENLQQQMNLIKKGVEMCARECEYFSVCGGGSASNKYFENGRFDSTTTSTCTLSNKVLTEMMLNKLQSKRVAV